MGADGADSRVSKGVKWLPKESASLTFIVGRKADCWNMVDKFGSLKQREYMLANFVLANSICHKSTECETDQKAVFTT